MKNKNETNQNKKCSQKAGVRVSQPIKDLERSLLEKANSMTNFGRKVYSEDLYKFALELVSEKHLKDLKLSKITGDDIDDMLLQKFKEKDPHSTSSDYRNFQRSSEWPKFLKEYKPENLLSEFVR